MILSHVLEEGASPDKCSTALSLLAHQLGRPVGRTHVILQLVLLAKLLSTARLLTEEDFLFQMDNLDVSEHVILTSKVF